jgi:hypothetical protein
MRTERFEHSVAFRVEQIFQEIHRDSVIVDDQDCWGVLEMAVHQEV